MTIIALKKTETKPMQDQSGGVHIRSTYEEEPD